MRKDHWNKKPWNKPVVKSQFQDRSEKALAFGYVLYKWDIDYRLAVKEHTGEVKLYSPVEITEYVTNNLNENNGETS